MKDETVCQIVRLLGEVAALQGGHAEKKRFLMDELCQLVGAESWLWTLSQRIKPGEPQTYAGFLRGGFDDDRFARFLKAVEHRDMAERVASFFQRLEDTMEHSTMRRSDIDPEGKVDSGPAGQLWVDADIGPLVMSAHPVDENSISGIGIYRRNGDRDFTDEEKNVIHIVLKEIPWLHMQGWPEDRGVTVPHLYPQQRIALNLLLDGMSRKEIADKMEISENTVSGYVKEVYRHFGVNSHVELMKKFLHAEGVN